MIEKWVLWHTTIGHQYHNHPTYVYEVSNLGNVRINSKLKDFSNTKGYYKIRGTLVHRIVAELFIPNPENKPYVDHIDTNIHNNRVDNLRWVTSSDNNFNTITYKKKRAIYDSDEYRKKLSESHKGKHLSEETKQKMSESHKGKIPWNKGKHKNK